MSNEAESMTKRVERGEFPAAAQERFLGWWDGLWLMSAYGIGTWNYLLGGWIAAYVGFWPAVGALLLIVPAGLYCAVATVPHARYGLDQFIGMRAWLGKHGPWPAMVFFVVVIWGWAAMVMIMAGKSFNEILGVAGISTIHFRIMAILFTIICWLIAWKGALFLRWFTRLAIPFIVTVTISIIALFAFKIGFGPVLEAEPAYATGTGFDLAVAIGLGLSWVCWYIGLGQVARSYKSESSAVGGVWLGMGVLSFLTGFVGIISSLYIGDPDPTVWLIPIGGLTWGIISLSFIIFANFTSAAVLFYCWGESVKAHFPRINWTYAMAVALGTIILCIVPWVYEAFNSFVALSYLITAPLVSIALVDFFILKKQKIKIKECYAKEGDYHYWKGLNWYALVIWWGTFALGVLIYNPMTYETMLSIGGTPIFYYITDIIPVTVLSAILYYLGGKYFLKKKYPQAYE